MPISIQTHCPTSYPPGMLPVPPVPGGGTVYIPAGGIGVGGVRGVAVLMHGLAPSTVPAFPFTAVNTGVGSFFPVYYGDVKDQLLAAGWVVLYPTYPEDHCSSSFPSLTIQGAVNADGSGAGYTASTLLWWDHIVDWSNFTLSGAYSTQVPVVPVGFSWGGLHALQVAGQKTSTIKGYVAHCPATILSAVGVLFTLPANYSTTPVTFDGQVNPGTVHGTPGLDVNPHILDNCGKPGIISYGTGDQAVGWQYPGGALPNSNTDQIITNAQAAGRPVTRRATTNDHFLTSGDAVALTNFVAASIAPSCPKVY